MWPFRRDGAGGAADPAPVSAIDVRDAYSRQRRGAKLVDVRSPAEFRSAHARGARNVPPALIVQDAIGLARDDELLVICLSGHRSAKAARQLARMGFSNVANVRGGLAAWQGAGLPTKR